MSCRFPLAGAFACLLLCLLSASPASAHGTPDHRDTVRDLRSGDPVARGARSVASVTGLGLNASPWSLPAEWCGTQRSSDHPSNPVGAAKPQVKVVYTWPADQPNRFAEAAPALQASVSAITKFVAASSGYRKTLRFDLGTDCGPQYVDILAVGLPGPRANYQNTDGTASFGLITAELDGLLGDDAGPRSVLVLADNVDESPWGMGQMGIGNGRSYAVAFNGASLGSPYDDGAFYPSLLLHEVTHNLGAVSDMAPYTSGAGHCRQSSDVMCYDDGGPKVAQLGMEYACDSEDLGPVGERYDCNGDDYFNPAPAPGSWLAGDPYSNVYHSPLMGNCAELLSSCSQNLYTGGDADGDGLDDPVDECPAAAGPYTTSGCPDSDGDGHVDNDDACPTQAGPDGDECPRLPGQRSKIVTLKSGKRKVGTLKTTMNPGRKTFRSSGTVKLWLAKGRYKMTSCTGQAKTRRSRKLTRQRSCTTKKFKVQARGRSVTVTAKRSFPVASVPRYVSSTVTVKRGKRAVRYKAKPPVVRSPTL